MSRQVRVLFETPITFDVPGRLLHSPMVHVNVAGIQTKLILDTGSTDHVFTLDLGSKAGLQATPADPGTDHAGEAVPSWNLGDAAIEIGNTSLHLQQVVAIEGPPLFEGWDVGGFLSPQNLHGSGFMVIDLAENQLALVEAETSQASAWLRARHPKLRLLSVQREHDELIAVRASIEPFAGVIAMLNSGSSGTEFARRTVPDLRGEAAEEVGYGVSGAEVEGEEVAGQALLVGGVRFPLSTLLVREGMPPPYGIIGMDVLSGTILAISSDLTEPVLWLVPNDGQVVRPQ